MGIGKIVTESVTSALGIQYDAAAAFASDNLEDIASLYVLGDALCIFASVALLVIACILFVRFAKRHTGPEGFSEGIPHDVALKTAALLCLTVCAALAYIFVTAWAVSDIIGWAIAPNAMLLDMALGR